MTLRNINELHTQLDTWMSLDDGCSSEEAQKNIELWLAHLFADSPAHATNEVEIEAETATKTGAANETKTNNDKPISPINSALAL